MPRKTEFNISIAILHISGLWIYLEFKIKTSFLRIINFTFYNDIWIYFHESYSTLWSCEHLSRCHSFKINFKTTFHVLLLGIHICEIDCKKWLVHFNIRNFMSENCQFSCSLSWFITLLNVYLQYIFRVIIVLPPFLVYFITLLF